MFCLSVIKAMNDRACVRPSVDCRSSSAVRSRGGVVVHSAALRSTAFLMPGARATRFWKRWQTASDATRHRMQTGSSATPTRDPLRGHHDHRPNWPDGAM